MIQVENLSISYSASVVFKEVAFTINPKERCALVGRNGSGKTTLFRLLIGEESADTGTIAVSRGYRIGYLDQHIHFSKPTILEEACLGLKEEERDDLYKAEKILFGLGFQEKELEMTPEKLSGGFQLRLQLAKVLLSQPNCLLLDEPTNYLDILSMRFLARFLESWHGELLLISHDRQFIDSVTTHTLGIHRNKIYKVKGRTDDFFNQILLQEEIYEKTRANQEKTRVHLQSYVDRFGAKASKASQAQSKKKLLEKIPALEQLKKLYELDFNFHEMPFHGKKLVEVKNISFTYEGKEERLIHELSLTIEKREKVAIIGKNGYGKSTLLRLIAREFAPKSGEITTSDQVAIGYFGQTHINRLEETKTIEEEIGSANRALTFSEVKKICGQMMFTGDVAKKKIGVLSGGEKSRVLLGKILAKRCNLLLLDEPTHHLDVESIEALIDALEAFEGAVVIVTHSELILTRLAFDKLVICHLGNQELFLGNYENFLEKKGWEEEASFQRGKMKPIEQKKSQKQDGMSLTKRKSLKEEIERLEKMIMQLEEDQRKDYSDLTEASQRKETAKIQEVAKRTREREKKIEELYRDLEQALASTP